MRAAGKFGGPKIFWPLAAAAMLAVLFVTTPLRYEIVAPGPAAVAEAARSLPERNTPGRLASGFTYKPLKDTLRGGPEDHEAAAKAKLYTIALQNEEALFKNARTAALTAFLDVKTIDDLNAAVALFEEAVAKARGRNRDLAENDLAAALLARGRWTGEVADYKRAFTYADAVWKRTKMPEAAWNRAMALEETNQEEAEAKAAWEEYLKLDPNSEWAQEARGNLEDDTEFSTLR
ncbi:MAG TPA: hypothetical protein VHK90_16315 [Thermoanaerobaculia bacterium]|nr:hypothetical protein [Thermoanaerobaculia bacterium]